MPNTNPESRNPEFFAQKFVYFFFNVATRKEIQPGFSFQIAKFKKIAEWLLVSDEQLGSINLIMFFLSKRNNLKCQ